MADCRFAHGLGFVLAVVLALITIPGLSYASCGPEDSQTVWEEAASFAEFTEKLDSLKQTGGNLRLTADIIVEQDERYEFIAPRLAGKEPICLDFGPYTVTVRGMLLLYPYLNITGQGGGQGLFHVEDGGWLELRGISLTAENGIAVRQEERSVLSYGKFSDGLPDFTCEGGIVSAGPVAVPRSADNRGYLPVLYVRDGEQLKDRLPRTDTAALCENGDVDYGRELPVVWNTEAFAEKISRRERFLLTGAYADITAVSPPQCLVTFEAGRPATLLDCQTAAARKGLVAGLRIALARPGTDCRIEWSSDGLRWQACPFQISDAKEDWIAYDLELPDASYPFYLSAVALSEAGETGYSDTIRIDGPDALGEIGGNRGGGTDILKPALPPASDVPQSAGCEAPSSTSSAPGPDEAPSAIPETENGQSSAAPSSLPEENGPAAMGSEPPPSPAPSSTPSPRRETTETPRDGQEEQVPADEMAGEKQEKGPDARLDTAVQVAAGLAAIAGLAVLVFTWNPKSGWGAKAIKFFKRFRRK